jgi:hypothetical protein
MNPDAFEANVEQIGQVHEVAFVTGRFDYQRPLAYQDADDLERLVPTP